MRAGSRAASARAGALGERFSVTTSVSGGPCVPVDARRDARLRARTAGLAPVARRSDEPGRFPQPRVLARGDALHGPVGARRPVSAQRRRGARPFAAPARQRASAARPSRGARRGAAAAGRTPRPGGSCRARTRARSSIASEPVLRSRTSASSASLRASSFALASRCAAELPLQLAHLQPAALAEPHRILQRDDQQRRRRGRASARDGRLLAAGRTRRGPGSSPRRRGLPRCAAAGCTWRCGPSATASRS